MNTSIDISLYPLADDYIPAIQDFIDRISSYDGITVLCNDLSTQLYGDYDKIMDSLKVEIKRSWDSYGAGVFVVKFLLEDLRLLDEKIVDEQPVDD